MAPDDAPRLKDHWWPRPGWRPGRIMLTWHLTFEHATDLHALVRAYQQPLAALPDLHLIPAEWLHLTVQGLGYADEITDDQLTANTKAVTDAVAALSPFELTFGRPAIRGEAIGFHPEPAHPVHMLWSTIRGAIAAALGSDAVRVGPEQTHGFQPHVSIAYASAERDATPYINALDSVHAEPAAVPVTSVSLIRQDRVLDPEWVYRWTTAATAPLRI